MKFTVIDSTGKEWSFYCVIRARAFAAKHGAEVMYV